jgi:hypothetical protein
MSRRASVPPVDHQLGYYGAAMGTEAVWFLVLWMAGWIHSRQLEVSDFLREENRVLREQLGGRCLCFTDDPRRRLAVKSRIAGRRRPGELAGLVVGYVVYYHRERNHQGLGNRLLTPAAQGVRPASRNAPVERLERLGRLLNFYDRRAA